MATKGFIDIHCHSVMTHYRNRNKNIPVCQEMTKGIWPLLDDLSGKESLRSYNTQSDFGKLAKNDAQAIIISLYAVERKWLLPKSLFKIGKVALISNVTGFSTANVNKMAKEKPIKYYEDLEGEYQYLKEQIQNPCNGKKFKIATDYSDFEQNLQAGDTVSIILSIEGASSLGKDLDKRDLDKKPRKITVEDYNDHYKENVFKMKSWGPDNDGTHAPLFITFAHHYWNMLCGHCESLPFIFHQKTGKETGITDAGEKMIKDLLSNKDINGKPNKTRRVLIDIKHMSPLSREWYYQHLVKEGLKVPIIVSHASVGDAPNLKCFIKRTHEKRNFKNPNNFFNTSSLSLNDEDVDQIVKSDGLIGIILHEKRIASKMAMKEKGYGVILNKKFIGIWEKEIERIQIKIKQAHTDAERALLGKEIDSRIMKKGEAIDEIKNAYVCMIMANIFKVVETTHLRDNLAKGKGWEHVCIGSDFDGTINKMDYFGTANEFPDLRKRFLNFLKNPEPLTGFNKNWTAQKLKDLQFGISPENLTEMFFSGNVNAFLKKYFTEDYLRAGD